MARTIAEVEAELAQVRKAIAASYGAQEFEIESGGARRRLRRVPLKELTSREADLVRELTRLGGGGGVRIGIAVN